MARNKSGNTPKDAQRGAGGDKGSQHGDNRHERQQDERAHTSGNKDHQRQGDSTRQGEVRRDRHDEDERRRMTGNKEKEHSMAESEPDDHPAVPNPGEVGAPEYYARSSSPRVAQPGPVRRQTETVEEEEEED